MAAKKGVNVLERGSQVHFMSEFMTILDFPPAPKLDIYGELDAKATPSEAKGQTLFTGKARCATGNPAPYYTDNSMHKLKAERFYKQTLAGGMMRSHDGPITTFPLRGIKDSPRAYTTGEVPDAGGHDRVLQPHPAASSDGAGEEGLGGLPPLPVATAAG